MQRPATLAHWKLLLHEDEPGDLDWAVDRLRRDMSGDIKYVQDDYWTQDGEIAIMQVMENLNQTLIGINADAIESVILFQGHYNATRGRHLLSTMGHLRRMWEEQKPLLRKAISEAGKESERCKIIPDSGERCSLVLSSVPTTQGEDWEDLPPQTSPPPPRDCPFSPGWTEDDERWMDQELRQYRDK